jgi:hypothetical protein
MQARADSPLRDPEHLSDDARLETLDRAKQQNFAHLFREKFYLAPHARLKFARLGQRIGARRERFVLGDELLTAPCP